MTNDRIPGSPPPTSPGDEHLPKVDIAGPSPLDDTLIESDLIGKKGSSARATHGRRPRDSRRRELPSPPRGPLKKILFLLTLILVSYSLAGFFLAPYLITTTLPSFVGKKLNRPVTIGSAQVNPYTLNIILKNGIIGADLGIADDEIDPILSFGRIEARLNPAFFLNKGHLVKAIRGNSVFVHCARQEDGSLNLAELGARLRPSVSALNMAHLADLIQAGDIHFSNSRLTFTDQPSASQHIIEEISFSLPKRDKDSAAISPQFSAIIDGSPISVGGQSESSATGQNTRLNFTLEKINLADYLAYLPQPLPGLISKGEADMELLVDYRISPDKTSHLEITGSGTARDIWLHSPEKGENKIAAASFSLSFAPLLSQLTISKLTLEQPEIQLQREKDGSYIFPGASQQQAAAPGPPINLDTLVVKNGRLSFIDQKVQGGFGAIFNDINLSIDRGKTADSRHAYALNCVTSRKTRIASQGEISLATGTVDGLLILHNLPMTALNTYLPPEKGVSLSSGTVDKAEASLHLNLQNDQQKTFTLSKLKGTATNLDIYFQGKEWLHIDQGTFSDATFASEPAKTFLGSITLSGLLGHFSPANTLFLASLFYQEKDQGPESFADLKIQNGRLQLNDFGFQKKKALAVNIISAEAAGFGRKGKSRGKVSAVFTLPQKGKCQVQGELSLAPLAGTLQLQTHHLPLDIFAVKQMDWFAPLVQDGTFDFTGNLTLPDLAFKGRASLNHFAARANNTDNRLITLQQATTPEIHLSLKPFTVKMAEVELDGLELYASLSQEVDSLTSLFVNSGKAGDMAQGNLAIDKINLKNGSLHFSDKTLNPPFAKSLTEIHGTFSDLTNSPGTSMAMNISGHTDDQATLTAKGSINLFSDSFGADLNVALLSQPLAPFIPYLEPMVGYSLSAGIFDLAVLYRESMGKVNADTVLTLHNFILGDQELGNRQFPASLALVTDNENIITLNVPVVGDMTDPSYTFHSAYGKKLRNLISKASVSPFSMLTDFYDPDLAAPDHVLFEIGSTEPSAASQPSLLAIQKIMANRPFLSLTLKGYSAGSEDRDALLQQKKEEEEKKRLAIQNSLSADLAGSYGQEEIVTPLAMAPGVSSAILTVSKEDLLALANERCLRLREILIDQYGIDGDRILISPEASVVPESGAGLAGNRADFILGRADHGSQ